MIGRAVKSLTTAGEGHIAFTSPGLLRDLVLVSLPTQGVVVRGWVWDSAHTQQRMTWARSRREWETGSDARVCFVLSRHAPEHPAQTPLWALPVYF